MNKPLKHDGVLIRPLIYGTIPSVIRQRRKSGIIENAISRDAVEKPLACTTHSIANDDRLPRIWDRTEKTDCVREAVDIAFPNNLKGVRTSWCGHRRCLTEDDGGISP